MLAPTGGVMQLPLCCQPDCQAVQQLDTLPACSRGRVWQQHLGTGGLASCRAPSRPCSSPYQACPCPCPSPCLPGTCPCCAWDCPPAHGWGCASGSSRACHACCSGLSSCMHGCLRVAGALSALFIISEPQCGGLTNLPLHACLHMSAPSARSCIRPEGMRPWTCEAMIRNDPRHSDPE